MNSKTWTRIIALTLFAALAIPFQLAAQDKAKPNTINTITTSSLTLARSAGPTATTNRTHPRTSLTLAGRWRSAPILRFPIPSPPIASSTVSSPTPFVWQHGVLTDLAHWIPGIAAWPLPSMRAERWLGVSENGQIDPLTGNYEGNRRPLEERSIINLGTLGGTQSVANGINDRGQVVGAALNAIPDPFANIPLLGCGTFAQCFLFVPAATQTHAFRWTEAGGMQDLGALGGPDSSASFVNQRGQIAGEFFTSFTPNPSTGVPTRGSILLGERENGGHWHPRRYLRCSILDEQSRPGRWLFQRGWGSDRVMRSFGTKRRAEGPRSPGGERFEAQTAINDAGEIVGGSDATSSFQRGPLEKRSHHRSRDRGRRCMQWGELD